MHNAREFFLSSISSTFLTGLVCVGLSACDPRAFDDLAEEAWVQSSKKPGDLEAVGYGIGLVAGGGDSLQYIVATEAPPAAIMVKFNQAGDASTQSEEIRNTLAGAQALTGPVLMASDPDGFDATNGNVAVATFDGNGASLFMMRAENGRATTPFNIAGAAPVTGLAFGDQDVGRGADLVAIAGNTLSLLSEYQDRVDPNSPAFACTFVGTGGGALFADIDATEGEEVLFAADGIIYVSSVSDLTGAGTFDEGCFDTNAPLATIEAPGGEASFGTLLLSADFDGNGERDLVITARNQNAVYVYLNYSTENPSEGEKITTPANATDFGISVATGDIDGDGRDELVIGDPLQRADGHARAGIVYLYTTNASGSFQSPIELHDASPENDQHFGQSLAIAKAFGGDRLVVGANNEVFTYFQTPLAGDADFRN